MCYGYGKTVSTEANTTRNTEMTTYTATFANETISRNSNNAYTHAFMITNTEGKVLATGFSASETGAHNGANNNLPKFISPKDRKNPAISMKHRKIAKIQGKTLKEWYSESDNDVTEARKKTNNPNS